MEDLPTPTSASTVDEPVVENVAGSQTAAATPARRLWLVRSVILVLRTLGWFFSVGWVVFCAWMLYERRAEAGQPFERIVVGVLTVPWVVVWIVLWKTRRDTDRAGAAAILTVGLWITLVILAQKFG